MGIFSGTPIIGDLIESTIGKVVDKALSYLPSTATPQEREAAAKDIRDGVRQVILAQIEVNKLEIGSGRFIGMWRAGLGWCLTFAAAWNFILYPFFIAIILMFNPAFPVQRIPVLDWKQLGSILMGMLGLGG